MKIPVSPWFAANLFERAFWVEDRVKAHQADNTSDPANCSIVDSECALVFGKVMNVELAQVVCQLLNSLVVQHDPYTNIHWLELEKQC